MADLTPDRVVATIASRVDQRPALLHVYWLRVSGDRNQYQRSLRDVRGELSIVPLKVGEGFTNANAIHSDLARIIDSHREEFSGITGPIDIENPLIVVLLARTDLGVPQVASPAALPTWLPQLGGTTTEVVIENLVIAATAPLNAAEARIEEISEELFRLEGVLLTRLTAVRVADHRLCGAFLDRIRERGSSEKHAEMLDGFARYHDSVRHASAFRPSAGEGQSLIGRIMRLASATSPDGFHAIAEGIASALALPAEESSSVKESFLSVLFRSSTRNRDPAARLAKNLLISVFGASQFVTAAAHSDDYTGYLVVLLQASSYDLREALRDISDFVSALPAVAARPSPASAAPAEES